MSIKNELPDWPTLYIGIAILLGGILLVFIGMARLIVMAIRLARKVVARIFDRAK